MISRTFKISTVFAFLLSATSVHAADADNMAIITSNTASSVADNTLLKPVTDLNMGNNTTAVSVKENLSNTVAKEATSEDFKAALAALTKANAELQAQLKAQTKDSQNDQSLLSSSNIATYVKIAASASAGIIKLSGIPFSGVVGSLLQNTMLEVYTSGTNFNLGNMATIAGRTFMFQEGIIPFEILMLTVKVATMLYNKTDDTSVAYELLKILGQTALGTTQLFMPLINYNVLGAIFDKTHTKPAETLINTYLYGATLQYNLNRINFINSTSTAVTNAMHVVLPLVPTVAAEVSSGIYNASAAAYNGAAYVGSSMYSGASKVLSWFKSSPKVEPVAPVEAQKDAEAKENESNKN